MNDGIHIRRALDEDLMGLAAITLDCVAGGASIGFMETLTLEQSAAFWQKCLESAGRSERIILVAQDADSDVLVGTVQLVMAAPENQPHRADIAKLQVHRNVRGNGIASKLMNAIECEAWALGRHLLVLDTVTKSPAEGLYLRLGWSKCGEIPKYALWPNGEYCSTTVFYKDLADRSPVTRADCERNDDVF